MADNVEKLLGAVLQRYHGNRLILGVDGLSRAGKTKLVGELTRRVIEAEVNVCVFHLDDHIVERKKRYHTGFEQWHEYYHLQWDVQYLRQELFSRIRTISEVSLPFYDASTDKAERKTVEIPDGSIVIIEGVFLQREEWREFFDLVVYLDCPREARFQRESLDTRGQIEKFQERYWRAEDYYLKAVKPRFHADMIIDS